MTAKEKDVDDLKAEGELPLNLKEYNRIRDYLKLWCHKLKRTDFQSHLDKLNSSLQNAVSSTLESKWGSLEFEMLQVTKAELTKQQTLLTSRLSLLSTITSTVNQYDAEDSPSEAQTLLSTAKTMVNQTQNRIAELSGIVSELKHSEEISMDGLFD